MAKLLKHLGIGGGKKSSSPRLDYDNQKSDRIRPFAADMGLQGTTGTTDTETDSSASTVSSSAARSTTGSEEFPPPPGSWIHSVASPSDFSGGANAGDVGFGGARPKEGKTNGNVGVKSRPEQTNIYENQEMFKTTVQPTIFNEDCWHEVKKWLQEMSNPSQSSSVNDPNRDQADFDNARFLAEILMALQKARSEAASHRGKTRSEERAVGGMLQEVAQKLESEYERARRTFSEKDYERYTQLKELLRFEVEEPLVESNRDSLLDAIPNVNQESSMMVSGYDEPWDLEGAQGEIEDEFNGVQIGDWILKERDDGPRQKESNEAEPVAPHEADIRTQRGYEKPWDWKPHMRDDRGPEGYDKPWDWKPHMKDDRPAREYEEPWDKKSNRVENEVIAAKIAKESAKAGRSNVERQTSEDIRGQEGYDKPWDWKPHQKDSRPVKEYDEPWDKKCKDIETDLIAAKIAKEAAKLTAAAAAAAAASKEAAEVSVAVPDRGGVSRNVKDVKTDNELLMNFKRGHSSASVDGTKSSASSQPVPAIVHNFSPYKKPIFTPDLNQIPRSKASERVQTKVSLEDQRWYHGSINRSQAESILQGHKEASYLVRKSEHKPDEYSLSVRSSKGYMHMKIVVDRDGKFILGQFSQPFHSIPQMIQYYSVSKLPIKGAEHMSLMYSVPKKVL